MLMENKFSKFINLQGKYLTSLLILLALSIGYAWADTGVSAGTYELSSTYKPGSNKRFKSIGTGIYLHRVNNSSWSSDFGMKLKDNQNGVAFYISSGMDVSFRYYKNSNSKAETTTFSVYTISSSDYALFTGGTENSTNVELTLGTAASATKTVELDASYKDYKVTDAIALTAGYYYIVGKDDTSNGTTYWTSLTLTSACSTSITTQPSGATLAVGDANPTLSIVATNAASYAWKESSDGTSYDGGSSLASTASFTPEVNDAVQTKYYYCEVTSSCDGTTVVKSNIVTVNVVGAITYYTVTLVPAGGTISDATGWTLNAGNYEKEVAEGTELTLPTFTKENRNFKTWRKAGPADVASPVTVNSDLALTAVWTVGIENVLYSWESPDGTAIETGGTATHYNGDEAVEGNTRVNYVNGDYHTISLDGSKDAYTGSHIRIALNTNVKAGDKVKMTAYRTKGDKAAAAQMMTQAGDLIFNGNNIAAAVNTPELQTYTVPAGIDASAVKLTRHQTGTGTFITKLQIIREVQVEEGDLLKVTLNYNDGSTPNGEILVASGSAATKPADPTWAHHRFNEWQLSGSAYNWATTVSSNITLVADWTQLYTISFANGGGSGDAPAAIADKAEGETFEVPANTFTAPEGKEFDKWNDGTNDYAPGATYTVGTSNVTLTAVWKTYVPKYTVHYMDEDGTTPLGDDELVDVGQKPAGVTATKPLFALASWQLSGNDIALDAASWASVAANEEVTLTARWTKVYAETIDLAAEAAAAEPTAINTFFGNHGYASTVGGSGGYDTNASGYLGYKFKNNGDEIQFNLQNGKIADIAFMYIETNFKVYVDGVETYTVTNKSTSETPLVKYIYANGVDKLVRIVNGSANNKTSVINKIAIHDPYIVTYDATTNGGDALDPGTATFTGTALTLPTAVKGTDNFIGWYDDATAGTKIGDADDEYIPSANITLYAHFESISTDARLASITFDPNTGTLSPAFDPEVVNYTYTMPYGTATVPTISGATAVHAKAKEPVIVQQASAWNETAIIRGVAESDDTKAYNITMKIAPKDGVSIIKVATTGGTNKTVTGAYAGDGDVSLSSNTKMDDGKFIGFTLDGTTLQAGDRINVHTTTAANTEGSHIIFYDNMTDKNELYETGEIGGTGDNIFVINAAMVGATTAYVYRSNADNAHKWNGYVDFIEVLRAMNPVLKAITIDGRAGVIDEVNKTVAVQIPYEAVLSSLTVVPTIVWNAPAASNSIVVNSGSAWTLSDNTYVLTDKDGDATTYTITLTRDVEKYTVSYNTHGGSAVASELVVAGEKLAAAPADPTREDYIFQGWSLTDGGAIIDITDVTIDANKTFHAVWASDGGIKLLDGEGHVNHVDFITAMAEGTVNFDDADHNCVSFGSTGGTIVGLTGLNKVVAYNATTTQTKVKFVLYNANGSAKELYLQKVLEDATEAVTETIAVPSKERFETTYYSFNSSDLRSFYVTTNSTDVKILQVKVVDDGTALKRAGEVGYELNLNKGRVLGAQNAATTFEGLAFSPSSNAKVLNSTELPIKTPLSFSIAAPVKLTLTTTQAKYYVSQNPAEDGSGTTASSIEIKETGEKSFNLLTAGTWYIVPSSTSNVKITNISFSATAADYVRDDSWMAPGELGTVCIEHGAVAVGADIYELVGRDAESGKIAFESVDVMEPGKPYLFRAKSNRIDFYYTAIAAATEPKNSGSAMKGTFEEVTLTELANVYYFNGTALWSCVDLSSLTVPAYRAYVKMDEMKPAPAPAPGRRRITLGVNGEQTATALDNLNASEKPVKLLIDGQLFIIRGERMFDASGRLVK